jgi:transcriptional regulator with XRE-family HTH domain
MENLASRLTWARNQKNMSQHTLAKKANVSQGSIGHLEAGLRKTSRSITSIAVALEVDPVWLATGKGEPIAKTEQKIHNISEDRNEYQVATQISDTAQFIIDLLNKTDARGQLKIKLAVEDAYLQHQSIGRSTSEKAAIAATKEEETLLSIYREVPDYFKSIVLTAAHNVKNSANPKQPRPTTETDKKSG